MFIAAHCPSMRVEALKMAIQYVMGTYNVTLYQQLHKKLQETIGYVSAVYVDSLTTVFTPFLL